jgi:hypothetical protein
MQQNIPYSYGKIYWCSIETEKKRNAYTVRLKDGETKKTAKIMVLGISYGKEMPLTKKSIYYVKEY